MSTPDQITIDPDSIDQAPVRGPSVRVPFLLPEGQEYFWTKRWRDAENESRDEIDRGEFLTFDSNDPEDVAQWLLSDSSD